MTIRKTVSATGVLRCAAGLMIAASGVLLAAASGAQVVEQLSTSSSYTYDFLPGLPGVNAGTGDSKSFGVTGSNPSLSTNIAMNYGTVLASDDSFFFLHNIQCQGYCSIGVTTTITDTITNNGSTAINLRLDSNITAGHLGLVQNAMTDTSGMFQFDVSQNTNGADHQLYQALGQISSSGASITTSDGSLFSNLSSYADPTQKGLDWDATDLSVILDALAPGATTTVTYTSVTYLNSYGVCTNFARCDGVQVAFGDPRNNGGILNLTAFAKSNQKPLGYVLNRGFEMAGVRMDLVPLPGSVPEASTWAMALIGFGLTGAAVRRRRTGQLATA